MTIKKHESISATELARNVSMSIDKVRISGRSMYITKGSQTVAELCPPPKSGFSVEKLGDLLRSLPKLGTDAEFMKIDLEKVRVQAKLPGNSWD